MPKTGLIVKSSISKSSMMTGGRGVSVIVGMPVMVGEAVQVQVTVLLVTEVEVGGEDGVTVYCPRVLVGVGVGVFV